MCGRFSQHYSWQEMHDALSIIEPSMPQNLEPRYNLGRFQNIDVVHPTDGGNKLSQMLWELVPH